MLKVTDIKPEQVERVITDKTTFLRADKEQSSIITFTSDDWDSAKSYYEDKVGTRRGAVPYAAAFKMWVGAGRPIINVDDLKMERLAVEQALGLKYDDIPAEAYELERDKWIEAGKPEPERFIPTGVGGKFIAYVNDDSGIPTDESKIIHIDKTLIDDWRAKQGMEKGPTPIRAYHEVVSELMDGLTAHTLVTGTGRVYKFDGSGKKTITGAKVLQGENEELKRKAAVQESILAQILANPEKAAEIMAASSLAS